MVFAADGDDSKVRSSWAVGHAGPLPHLQAARVTRHATNLAVSVASSVITYLHVNAAAAR